MAVDRSARGIALSKAERYFGYNLDTLANYKKALANVSTKGVHIYCIGTSLTYGSRSSNTSSASWVEQLKARMQSRYGSGDFGFLTPHDTMAVGGGTSVWNWHWTNWTDDATGTYNGGSTLYTVSTSSPTSTGDAAHDFSNISGFDLEFIRSAGGGTATIKLDGVTQGTISCNGTGAFIYSLNVTSAAHTLTITPNGDGTITHGGVWIRQGRANGFTLHKLGTGGATVAQYLNSLPQNGGLWGNSSIITKPNLVILDLGMNDLNNISNAKTGIAQMIQFWQGQGACVLLLGWFTPQDTDTSGSSKWAEYRQMYYNLAKTYGCSFLDLAQAIPSWEVFANVYNFFGGSTALSTPSMPSSGTAYANSNAFPCRVYISGGTVTAIAVKGVTEGSPTTLGITSGQVTLLPGDSITLTYSVAPSWVWLGQKVDWVHPYDSGYLLVSRLIEPLLVSDK